MAVLKCKMCGGRLMFTDGESIARCEFCGSLQTVPVIGSERKQKLYDRADKLRFNCDFDKAASVFENIVNEFPDDAESYWGLLLCRYGIEYVDDPVSGKKIPTCHRASFDSILEDPDFDMIMENADLDARALYRTEAKQIEELRKSILEVSGREEPYDIFICYRETDEDGERTLDSVLAQEVYEALRGKGYRVFFSRISLEDKLGTEYEPYIFAALHSAKLMLAFGTSYDNYNAVWVKNEWGRFLKLMAADSTKHLIPCFRDMDAYDIPGEFAKYQAQDMGKVGAMQDLLRGVDKILRPQDIYGVRAGTAGGSLNRQPAQAAAGPGPDVLLKRLTISLEDGQWSKARELADDILDLNPENAEGYLGMFMAENGLNNREMTRQAYVSGRIKADTNFERFRKYAQAQDSTWIAQMEEERHAAAEEREQAQRIAAEAQKAKELAEAREFRREKDRLNALREKRKGTEGLLAFWYGRLCAVDNRGKVLVSKEKESASYPQEYNTIAGWEGIVSLVDNTRAADDILAAVRNDGTVVLAGRTRDPMRRISDWKGVKTLVAEGYEAFGRDEYRLFGLTEDGKWLTVNRSATANYYDKPGLSMQGPSDSLSGTLYTTDREIIRADGRRYFRADDGSLVRTDGHFPGQVWEGIVSVQEYFVIVAVKEDGSVVVDYKDSSSTDREMAETLYAGLKKHKADWSNIIAVRLTHDALFGITADGRIVCQVIRNRGELSDEEPNRRLLGTAAGWKLFDNPDSILEERNQGIEKHLREEIERRRKQKLKEAEANVRSLQKQRDALWGPFNRKKREETEESIRFWEEQVSILRDDID
ncbi:MAG: toll/interleukin-1 receptor domain-containing protein [Eubacterium sp.]|nr:toll/interleukin-1 receptor domain-containing protein [Eubacterium sp.]